MKVTAFSDLLRTEDAINLSHLERLRTHFERAGGTLNFRQFEDALARVLGEDASSDLYHRKVDRTAGCLLDGRKVTIFIHDWLPFAAEARKLLSIYLWLPIFILKKNARASLHSAPSQRVFGPHSATCALRLPSQAGYLARCLYATSGPPETHFTLCATHAPPSTRFSDSATYLAMLCDRLIRFSKKWTQITTVTSIGTSFAHT